MIAGGPVEETKQYKPSARKGCKRDRSAEGEGHKEISCKAGKRNKKAKAKSVDKHDNERDTEKEQRKKELERKRMEKERVRLLMTITPNSKAKVITKNPLIDCISTKGKLQEYPLKSISKFTD